MMDDRVLYKRVRYGLSASFLILGIFLVYRYFPDIQKSQSKVYNQKAQLQVDDGYFLVKRVVDGDTIELENGQKVRYIGIDTPETNDPKREVECYGEEAKEKNKSLVEGGKVKLEKDVSEIDKYSRLLRYVYLENGTFVNLLLVKEGYANASSYPPDIKHQGEFRQAEKEARDNKKGLWGDACAGSSLDNLQNNEIKSILDF